MIYMYMYIFDMFSQSYIDMHNARMKLYYKNIWQMFYNAYTFMISCKLRIVVQKTLFIFIPENLNQNDRFFFFPPNKALQK